jgi:hypothetical protein
LFQLAPATAKQLLNKDLHVRASRSRISLYFPPFKTASKRKAKKKWASAHLLIVCHFKQFHEIGCELILQSILGVNPIDDFC